MMATEQDTQDYRDDAPIPPEPTPDPGPTNWELFKAGFKPWVVAGYGELRTWWRGRKGALWTTVMTVSIICTMFSSLFELIGLFVRGNPPVVHWVLGLSLPVTFYALGSMAYEGCVDEGRNTLGLEED